MTHRLVTPPESFDEPGRLVFLAGPIQGASNWHAEAASLLLPHTSVASPRRATWDADDFVFDEQVRWESKHLAWANRYGVILFWLDNQHDVVPGRAYAQTTRFELGEWLVRSSGLRLVVGIHPGFCGGRYIKTRIEHDYDDVDVCDNLEATCKKAITLVTLT